MCKCFRYGSGRRGFPGDWLRDLERRCGVVHGLGRLVERLADACLLCSAVKAAPASVCCCRWWSPRPVKQLAAAGRRVCVLMRVQDFAALPPSPSPRSLPWWKQLHTPSQPWVRTEQARPSGLRWSASGPGRQGPFQWSQYSSGEWGGVSSTDLVVTAARDLRAVCAGTTLEMWRPETLSTYPESCVPSGAIWTSAKETWLPGSTYREARSAAGSRLLGG